MDKYSHLDLNTLLYIKQCFEFCSDGSTHNIFGFKIHNNLFI